MVGTEYLNTVLKKDIQALHENPNLDLEVEKEKMDQSLDPKELDQKVEDNLKKLDQVCQQFFDRICSQVMVDEMPRQIRAICYYIVTFGEIYKLDFEKIVLPLISGFVMLRYICPAITLPNNYGILSAIPQGNVRKNLTSIARTVQKCANGELFGTESPALMPLNEFIQRNQKKLHEYLKQLPQDPVEHGEGKLPFHDLQKTITYGDIHLKSFDIKDLIFIHQLIYEYGFELIVSLQNEVILTHDRRPVSIVSTETDFLSLIHDLGPPPEGARDAMMQNLNAGAGDKDSKGRTGSVLGKTDSKAATGKAGEEEKKDGVAKKKENLKGKSLEEIENTLLERSLDNLLSKKDVFDTADLEQAKFVYVGKPARNNAPVAYFVLDRVKVEVLTSNDRLMIHVYKTLNEIFDVPYYVVIDMSWAELDDEVQAFLYRAVVSFTRLMKANHLANCQNVFILHPTYKTQMAIDEILNMIPEDKRGKLLKMIYDWADLADVIEPLKIWIPAVSKRFVAATFKLVKINEQDKKQDRLCKVSTDTLMNIDIKTGLVQNEILLKTIEEVRTKQGSTELIIKYNPLSEQEIAQMGPGYFLKTPKKNEASPTGPQTRTYATFYEQQREAVVDCLFDSAIRSFSLKHPQVFFVNKVSKKSASKKKKRLLKFTVDSVLHFKDKTMIREIAYSMIQSFYIDQKNKNLLYINFLDKGMKKYYQVEHEQADKLRDALLDAIKRFKFFISVEKTLPIIKDYDTTLDKFFNASKSKSTSSAEPVDKKKWKQVLRVDLPAVELQKLFEKLAVAAGANAKAERIPFTTASLAKVVSEPLSEQELQHVLDRIDPEKKGTIVFEDIVKSWFALHKEKTAIEKRQAAAAAAAASKKK